MLVGCGNGKTWYLSKNLFGTRQYRETIPSAVINKRLYTKKRRGRLS